MAPFPKFSLHAKLQFLMEPHPYKVVHSGRFGMKTRSFSDCLLAHGAASPKRILCCREIMGSIRESVHAELTNEIINLGLEGFYVPYEREIRGANGTEIIFAGLHGQSAESMKSFANIDIAWVEEAQGVTKQSWDLFIPTIRKPGSEIWVSLNPGYDEEDTYKRWVLNPLPGTVVRRTNWRDAQEQGWFPEQENQKRLHCFRFQPSDYDNIWEGVPRSAVEGAIYELEMAQAQHDGRIRPVPYDPRLPVHTIWDLGWADYMAVIFVQKPVPTVVNVINYLEDNRRGYDEIVDEMDYLGYRFAGHWLPHDGANFDPKSKKSAKMVLEDLGLKNVTVMERTDPDAGIKAARLMFPRCYIDNTERKPRKLMTARLGGARLVEILKRYRRKMLKTGVQGDPVHDDTSHGADAWRKLGEIVDQLKNEYRERSTVPQLPSFRSSVRGTGMLG